MTSTEQFVRRRRIGVLGTAARVVLGLAGLALAVLDHPFGLLYGIQVHDLVLGFAVFPAAMVAVGLLAWRFATGPLRWAGPAGTVVNLAVLVVLLSVPYTAGAALLFYGTSLLIAAWCGAPGCEATVISNLILRRDDQIGCPVLTPIDALEAQRQRHPVKITLLTVPDCPNAALAQQRITEALAGRQATIERVIVRDHIDAARYGMTGSPTILLNGADPFRPPGAAASVSCRIQDVPSIESLRQAVTDAASQP